MALGDLYNSINQGTSKTKKSLTDYFGPVTYIAPPRPKEPIQYSLKDRGVQVSDEDLQAMRPLIYGEVSNRPSNKQTLESHVILNTALNRMREYAAKGKKKTLSEVIAMPDQYQAYGGPQYQAYGNSSNALDLAKRKQIDLIMDAIQKQIRSGQYPDTTQGAYYYIHNDDGTITYDNKKPLYR